MIIQDMLQSYSVGCYLQIFSKNRFLPLFWEIALYRNLVIEDLLDHEVNKLPGFLYSYLLNRPTIISNIGLKDIFCPNSSTFSANFDLYTLIKGKTKKKESYKKKIFSIYFRMNLTTEESLDYSYWLKKPTNIWNIGLKDIGKKT